MGRERTNDEMEARKPAFLLKVSPCQKKGASFALKMTVKSSAM